MTFSANGTNAAKSSVATFTKAGGYMLTDTITDSSELTTASTVSVTVAQTPTTITVSPPTASIVAGTTLQLAAAAADQFGSQLTTQPAFTWAATGTGSITSAGLFTAPVLPATATIRASASSVAGQATVTITYAAPGDTNLDGVVDVIDVANLVDGSGAASTSEVSWSQGDFNYDGIVDQLDLSDFLAAGLFDQAPICPHPMPPLRRWDVI